jgi:putative membrane protein
MRLAIASGIVLAGNLAPALAVAQEEGRYYYGHHMWDGGWGGMFFGPFFMILLLAVVVAAVVLVLRWLGPSPGHHAGGGKTALDILKERFARGEIDKEEFEERRRVLGD